MLHNVIVAVLIGYFTYALDNVITAVQIEFLITWGAAGNSQQAMNA